MSPNLIPELNVSDFNRSLWFYCNVIGFRVVYDRPEHRFAMLDLDGARLMIEQVDRPYTTRFATGNEPPEYARVMNLEIQVPEIDEVYDRVCAAALPLLVDMQDRVYRVGDDAAKVRQFVLADPNGFVIRLQVTSSG